MIVGQEITDEYIQLNRQHNDLIKELQDTNIEKNELQRSVNLLFVSIERQLYNNKVLHSELDKLKGENTNLNRREIISEEQIRQRDQAIEDLESQVENIRTQLADENIAEEARGQLQNELTAMVDRLEDLNIGKNKLLVSEQRLIDRNEVLQSEIDKLKGENTILNRGKIILEEQIRQRDQAIEDLENQAENIRTQLADENITEEARGQLQNELTAMEDRLAELNNERTQIEEELGMSRKEKIKRALIKYGVPTLIATSIAVTIGLIFKAFAGLGSGVKALGGGLKSLGTKIASSIPGLLGSVLSLALKAGGEVLKFVGNNVWILVIAIGAVLLKQLQRKK